MEATLAGPQTELVQLEEVQDNYPARVNPIAQK